MTMQWADELSGSEPDPRLESFYIVVAMKLGDPRTRDWLLDNAAAFHELYAKWGEYGPNSKQDSATVLVQYLLWYERDGPVDTNITRGT